MQNDIASFCLRLRCQVVSMQNDRMTKAAFLPFEPGCNPRRYLSAHRERGAVRYGWTMEQIARAAGVSAHTARRDVALRAALAQNDLVGVARWVVSKNERKRA